MKVFKITEQELQVLAQVLGEIPAKQVINAIDILRKLPELEPTVTENASAEG